MTAPNYMNQEPFKMLVLELAAGVIALVEKPRIELDTGVRALVEKPRAEVVS